MPRYDYRDGNRRFINPYNFIPLEDPSIRGLNTEDETVFGDETGYFVCELKAFTPLAIPDTERKKEDPGIAGHFRYPTYRVDETPVIPGSSLRGVIRSAYETLTNSCLSTLDPEEHITKRRNSRQPMNPCVLKYEDGKWVLYEAKRVALVGDSRDGYEPLSKEYTAYRIKTTGAEEKYLDLGNNGRIYHGEEVEIQNNGPGHIHSRNNREVWREGSVSQICKKQNTKKYLFLGEQIKSKHAESVFIQTAKNKDVNHQMIQGALKKLDETLSMYRSDSINRNLKSDKIAEKHYGYRGFERAKERTERESGGLPLWYILEDGHLYFSMAAIGRFSYDASLGKLTNGHNPCSDRANMCQACAVFGMIGKGKEKKGMGSRIRVTDAYPEKYELTADWPTLKELGSPRPSYLPFYSKNGIDYDNRNAEIRGRKYYWHNPRAEKDSAVYATNDKNNRNATFELIESDSTFRFKVYYDSLNSKQLEMLAWALTLGGNQTEYLHKIGHGKPLGLGSAKITIIEQVKRNSYGDAYQIEHHQADGSREWEKPGKDPELIDERAKKNLLLIAKFDKNQSKEITYPYVYPDNETVRRDIEERKDKNALANHQWFRDNGMLLPRIEGDVSMNSRKVVLAEKPTGKGQGKNQQRGNRR
ncbi:MAG: TIGR03986 family CRISPR-associated RAMP protein [Lachnospiraceae bacterium]|nr:TIGR03986 family CRISPR-associated RAMP protein [Lachnospiraceae bacterium]